MSQSVVCDFCRKHGVRRTSRYAPEKWLFLVAVAQEEDEDNKKAWHDAGLPADGVPDDAILLFACSKECCLGLWSKGPGPRIKGGSKA